MAAVAAPDGGAYVLLSPADRDLPQSLVTVGADFSIAGSVPLPRVEDVWGLHLLPDGAVAVTGRTAEGYGLEVVDPATGAVRTTTLAPAGARTDAESGRSTMAPGSSTLYLFLTVQSGDGGREELFAVDAASGQVLADRDLADDVAAASQYPVGRQLAGLVARPGGGATLVFDASPTEVAEDRIPTLLTYDAAPASRWAGRCARPAWPRAPRRSRSPAPRTGPSS